MPYISCFHDNTHAIFSKTLSHFSFLDHDSPVSIKPLSTDFSRLSLPGLLILTSRNNNSIATLFARSHLLLTTQKIGTLPPVYLLHSTSHWIIHKLYLWLFSIRCPYLYVDLPTLISDQYLSFPAAQGHICLVPSQGVSEVVQWESKKIMVEKVVLCMHMLQKCCLDYSVFGFYMFILFSSIHRQ